MRRAGGQLGYGANIFDGVKRARIAFHEEVDDVVDLFAFHDHEDNIHRSVRFKTRP